jgi:PAS domain S-box-containing protein
LDSALQKLAFDLAPVGIVLTEQRVIRACNATFCKMSGYERSALLGQSFRMLYRDEQEFEQIRNVGMTRLKEGGAYSDERLVHHRNGDMFWCRFRAVTLTPDEPLARTVLSFAPIPEHITDTSLTRRERQVVGFLSKGLTSKEIARRLGLSPRTVEDYRLRLCKKFGVKNTAGLLSRLVALEA